MIPWAPYHTKPISVVFEFCTSDFSGPPELVNSKIIPGSSRMAIFFLKKSDLQRSTTVILMLINMK